MSAKRKVNNLELTERKKKVLRSVVDLYIRTAEPVGSKAITALPDMKYSSATIRNEMADLTTMGYLEQPTPPRDGSPPPPVTGCMWMS